MEGSNRFGQQPGFNSGQDFDRPRPQPRIVGELTIGPNGRVIQPGQEKRNRGPVPGISDRRIRNSGQRNK